MSLQDIDSEEEYKAVTKKRRRRFLSLSRKTKILLILFLLAIILGGALSHFFVTPFVCEMQPDSCTVSPKVCTDCFTVKGILNKENQCLHSYVDSQAILDACSN